MVDNWLALDAAPKTGVLVKQLKGLLDRLLQRKIVNPHETLSSTDEKIVQSIMMLFETEPAASEESTIDSEPEVARLAERAHDVVFADERLWQYYSAA